MNDLDFKAIFLPHKERFLAAVRSFVSEFSSGVIFNRSAFQLFEDEDYWKQTHYINLMEKNIRIHLATGVLIDLLKYYNYSLDVPEKTSYRISSDAYDERDTDFQFAIIDNNSDTMVFIKYKDIPYDDMNFSEAEKMKCVTYKISHSRRIVLLWDNFRHVIDGIHIPLSDFFEEFLTLDLYDVYVEEVRQTVKEAESLIGFQTVERFTSTNVHRLLYTEYLSTIKSRYLEKKYTDISMNYYTPKEFKSANRELSEHGKNDVINIYFSNQRYLALIGYENYAKSFITAEYLFNTYKGDEFFDFTAIAACYAKAVEQLLFKVTMNYISGKNPNDSVIIRSEYKQQSIRVDSKTTDKWIDQFNNLGSLNYFWLDNKDFTILSDADRLESAALIHRYTFECRNQPFHSEPLSWPAVEKIRENSLMVLQLILGAINVKNNTGLGVIDDVFDRLISALIKPAKHASLLLFEFGEEKIWVKPELYNSHAPVIYDSNKRIQSSTLKFIVIEAQNSALKKDDPFSITERNIPDKAFYRGKNGLVEIEW